MSVLTVDNITVGFGKRLILENQSIVFDKPEIISIIGPNGSGKSTFLKALARLIKLKQGTISLDEKSLHLWNTKELARHIALLPQITTAFLNTTGKKHHLYNHCKKTIILFIINILNYTNVYKLL